MNPEMMQYLLGVGLVLLGYFVRHRGITIPGLPGPSGNPLVRHPFLSNLASAFVGYIAQRKGVTLPGIPPSPAGQAAAEAKPPSEDLLQRLEAMLSRLETANLPKAG